MYQKRNRLVVIENNGELVKQTDIITFQEALKFINRKGWTDQYIKGLVNIMTIEQYEEETA